MISLGIESTAHTLGIGIVDENGKILADERSIYVPPVGKGMVPREVADYHIKNAQDILKKALESSRLKLKDVDIISVALGPGLPPCLRVGATLARFLALKFGKPLVPVNHCIAHIEIGRLMTKAKDPVVVYTSGGNTQIIAYAEGSHRVFGETEDIPLGNAIDMLSRELGIQPPYGPNFDKIASKGKWIDLPYVVKGMDVSFSGLVTEALKKYKEGKRIEDICYSFQEVSYAMVTEVTERALAHTGKKEVLLVGGVAASQRLQEMMQIMCKERGAKVFIVPRKWSGDNGVMIAWTGILAYKHGQSIKIGESHIRQKWRTDEVKIDWL